MNRINLFILFLVCCNHTTAQILDAENKVTVTLSKDKTVTLYGQAMPLSDEKSLNYYYLPTNLRLAKKSNGTPQFLFLNYTTEYQGKQNTSGAILHLLMEFGLTKEQETQLQLELRKKVPNAVVKGAAEIVPDGDKSVRVISAILSSNGNSEATLIHSGNAPSLPGSKYALAASLDATSAELMNATLAKARSIADLSLSFSYNYNVRVPAVKGYIEENYSLLDSIYKKDSAKYEASYRSGLWGWIAGRNHRATYNEVRQAYEQLQEMKVITMRFEENVPDERLAVIREAFFNKFLNEFTQPGGDSKPALASQKEKDEMPNIKYGKSYEFKREFTEVIKQNRKRRLDLNVALSVKKSYELTENLASWYDNIGNNKECIGSVVLNDPFFQYRDINFILDLDANQMFGSELNFVTLDVRKKRDSEDAREFSHQITFDKKYFDTAGNRATIRYSKAQSEEPDMFEYKVKWSLRGGNDFPPNDTIWTRGRWQAINLSPPVKPVSILFQIDPDELKIRKIRNASLQIRYYKFGKEVESTFSIPVSSKNPSLENLIYMDKNSQGYAYRLVYYHEQKGPLAMPWESKININYVFASLPEEFLKEDQTFIQKAVEAAKTISGVIKESVLDKFKDIKIKD